MVRIGLNDPEELNSPGRSKLEGKSPTSDRAICSISPGEPWLNGVLDPISGAVMNALFLSKCRFREFKFFEVAIWSFLTLGRFSPWTDSEKQMVSPTVARWNGIFRSIRRLKIRLKI